MPGRNVEFKDFLWANCIFWTRALTIPCPHDFVFPKMTSVSGETLSQQLPPVCNNNVEGGSQYLRINNDEVMRSEQNEQKVVWIEGLVPGIDFCNHDTKAVVRWEVDGDGCITGVPNSMYLTADAVLAEGKEIVISYGNKGNEELLFLYGFVLKDNPDDYLMVHFPKDALDDDNCSVAKLQLLEEQMLSLQWLLLSSLLQNGFYVEERIKFACIEEQREQETHSSYSWSGIRRPPPFLHNFVFPEDIIAALRVVAMKEEELQRVLSMLEELSRSGAQKQPSTEDVRSAVWEVCGNSGALQLLTDLLAARSTF